MSPLLESSIDGARGVLINFIGGRDMSLQEVSAAAEIVYDRVDEEANIIFGATVDEEKRDRVRVMILATGFSTDPMANGLGNGKSKPKVDAPAVKLIYDDQPKVASKPVYDPTMPDKPSAKQDDEDLDIPAFLRRIKK
jgi:cell division protein FtsZ